MLGGSHWAGQLHFDRHWAAFRGASESNSLHAHAAWQLCVGHDQAIAVADEYGKRFEGMGMAIRPGVKHRLLPAQKLTLLFIEPQTLLPRELVGMQQNAGIARLPDRLRLALAASPDLKGLWSQVAVTRVEHGHTDLRLEQALRLLAGPTARGSIESAAQSVGLSASRLRTIARKQLGISLSSWIAWRKLERSGLAILAGEGLAAAAAEGGFADQAHFNRAMRTVFGITPGAFARIAT
jgi:AraC-like DNA-binding protein